MEIKKVFKENMEEMRNAYYNNLIAPMDDMYEQGIIPACDYYILLEEDSCYGYFCVNDQGQMMQFYIIDDKKEEANRILDYVLDKQRIKAAIPCTNDPLFYSLCEERAQNKEEVYGMFIANKASNIKAPIPDIMIDTEAKLEDIDSYFTYFKTIGVEGEWFDSYLNQRIKLGELILFKLNGKIIGSSEIRKSLSRMEYANLGITVKTDYRKRGLGSYFLSKTIEMTKDKALIAICGVDKTNTASLKAVVKAGFWQYHTYVKMLF